jgi:hypothetical protein
MKLEVEIQKHRQQRRPVAAAAEILKVHRVILKSIGDASRSAFPRKARCRRKQKGGQHRTGAGSPAVGTRQVRVRS